MTTTTRPVTFIATDADNVVRSIVKLPAGTQVHVGRIRRNGLVTIRVRGSLLQQDVNVDAIVATA